jgi:hypothetical protein
MWDAAKATLRGNLIAYAASKKKAMEAHRLDLERELECCEKVHNPQTAPPGVNLKQPTSN